jgi:hypothetical protein
VGEANFDWVVENVAQLAIGKALSEEEPQTELRWSRFLTGEDTKRAAAVK